MPVVRRKTPAIPRPTTRKHKTPAPFVSETNARPASEPLTNARTFFTTGGLLFSTNFQLMTNQANIPASRTGALLNSTIFQLILNTESRANFSESVLGIQTYETAHLKIVNPFLLPEPDAAVFSTAVWDVLTPSPQRRQIDNALFDALRLTKDEPDAV